ncbi:LysR substrate-binding domain-containing protein [Acetobacter cerevisiae]|uniref:LysR substrate-binding domain-containing protein n=1 Tax=Acetobacter cerevisiae TaxID=178900 RepID=UPI00209DBD45|nr:LysR substrate-binding domain-containing protein [Acetobacter cerevisiae]MCP1271472.1 LysR substrate-binding domain-containing protein [Acetobacter cerevisiae]MCP1279426.1 LysR substrate-binding domain-containing protein [Acetobacter cerevisiae]
MQGEASDLRFFTNLVDAGSITAAARAVGTSPAAISRKLATLEARLGVTLIIRTTRVFRLSEAGQFYYGRALAIVEEIDVLENEIASASSEPQGNLIVGAPMELGRRQIAPFIEAFSERYPKLQISLVLASEGIHDPGDGLLDINIRLGLPDTPGSIVTLLATTRRVLCASPTYFEKRPVLQTPNDLVSHDCLCIRRQKTMTVLNKWAVGNEYEKHVVTVSPKFSSTNCEIIHDWAVSGRGIAYKLLSDVYRDIASGRLVRILPDFYGEKVDLYAVMLPCQQSNANVRAFLDLLREFFRDADGFGDELARDETR